MWFWAAMNYMHLERNTDANDTIDASASPFHMPTYPKGCAEMTKLFTELRVIFCTFMHFTFPYFICS